MIKLWDVFDENDGLIGTFAEKSGEAAIHKCGADRAWSAEVGVRDVTYFKTEAMNAPDYYLSYCCQRYLDGIATDDEVENIAVALTDAS